MTLWIIFVFLQQLVASCAGSGKTCCDSLVGYTSCRTACQQLFEELSTTEQLQKLSTVAQTCPHDLGRFWQCINETFSAVSSSDHWSGKTCCELPLAVQCKNACQRARSREDLGHHCRASHDRAFFSCLDRQEESARCCNPATSSQCRAVCKAIFIENALPSRSQREAVAEYCDIQVATCVHNYTKTTPSQNPAESLPCCDQSNNPRCQARCRDVLSTMTVEEEIVDAIIETCGQPSLYDSLWQCFLRNSDQQRPVTAVAGTIETAGIDGAKLLCCSKASTTSCRNLCVKTYSRGWINSWNSFYRHCGYHPLESDLHLCLSEVDEPCTMGCTNLQYCTNFNLNPLQLYRSCNRAADKAAEQDVKLWKRGVISLPMLQDIPVKDIRYCHPEMWKAVACTLHIKPCQTKTHTTTICKSDCLRLLNDCVDWGRLPPEQSPESICRMLSAQEDQSSCIPLSKYSDMEKKSLLPGELTTPCQPNPCNDGQVCQINRRRCKHRENCPNYVCKSACPMGEVSSYLVAQNSYVRLPIGDTQNNFRVCKCGHHGMLSKCHDMEKIERDSCLLGSGRIHAHESDFYLGCKWCKCFAGETICYETSCIDKYATAAVKSQFTGLPCNCYNQYSPVCGKNGKTYPNSCVARCLGLEPRDFDEGSCHSRLACELNTTPCGPGEMCVPKRQVCLSIQSHCQQYECVSLVVKCNTHEHSPVCDTRGEEFNNMCLLTTHRRTINYRGHCQSSCSDDGLVCGVNGETYSSQCAAWADHVVVDYQGRCQATGHLVAGRDGQSVCDGVQCPVITDETWCRKVTPPGTCCPQCAGEIRILYSKTLVDKASLAARNGPITVHGVVEALEKHITILECGVFAYLGNEGDVVVLITPKVSKPTFMQLKACLGETEKLGALLHSGSPTLISHLALSPVTAAKTRTAQLASANTSNIFLPSYFLLSFSSTLVYLIQSLTQR